ncbi:MAG: 5-(carboxyamino)imidazole ribonucleotide mutase [Candidatus Altiarchaeales archaeon]|nr:5-(carboxyamino)imidazole ribonucleotide mutase [Candidatus Altiarchaeales archaeon]
MVEVLIIAGSKSDQHVVDKVEKTLTDLEVSYGFEVCSAHREPERLDELISQSDARVFICIAGLSAALPGVTASKTSKPVIGVPVESKLGGLDALLSTVQMPPGVPVACVGVDNGRNAAYLAKRILEA